MRHHSRQTMHGLVFLPFETIRRRTRVFELNQKLLPIRRRLPLELRPRMCRHRRLQRSRRQFPIDQKWKVQNIRMLHKVAHQNLYHERQGQKRLGRLPVNRDIRGLIQHPATDRQRLLQNGPFLLRSQSLRGTGKDRLLERLRRRLARVSHRRPPDGHRGQVIRLAPDRVSSHPEINRILPKRIFLCYFRTRW